MTRSCELQACVEMALLRVRGISSSSVRVCVCLKVTIYRVNRFLTHNMLKTRLGETALAVREVRMSECTLTCERENMEQAFVKAETVIRFLNSKCKYLVFCWIN